MKREALDRYVRAGAVGLIVLLGGSGIPDQVEHFNGITGVTRKNGSGCICHDEHPSRLASVWIEGPDTLLVGQGATYTVFVAKPDSRTAGFDVATKYGLLGVVDSAGTYWYENELTHAEPKPANGSDTISWEFSYTAPDSGADLIDTIYSAGNSTNQDTMATPEDKWNFGPDFPVVVLHTTQAGVSHPAVPGLFRLYQNYPNPFNPDTRIRFDLPERATIVLTVIDVTGRIVDRRTVGEFSAGSREVMYRPPDDKLSSGVYFYRVDAKPEAGSSPVSSTGKMMLLR